MSQPSSEPIDLGFMSFGELIESSHAPSEPSGDVEVEVPRPAVAVDAIVARLRTERLKRRKAARGKAWSQSYVAARLGASVYQSTVSAWESGHKVPPLPQLRAWAALLGFQLVLVADLEEMAA